jgi:two-component system, OmpR family, response regulator
MRILVVEDEPRIAADIREGLERAGYVAEIVGDGEAAWFRAETETYDAMVLDLGLPRLDGLGVLRRLRGADVALPVLILTARDGWRERVEGIDAGADDYLTKPFVIEELLARIRALTRRSVGHREAVFAHQGVEIDTRSRSVRRDGVLISVTPLEFRLLSYLFHHRGKVVPATELLDHLYDPSADRDVNAVELLVARVRRKVGADLIVTRRGFGYAIAPAGAA